MNETSKGFWWTHRPKIVYFGEAVFFWGGGGVLKCRKKEKKIAGERILGFNNNVKFVLRKKPIFVWGGGGGCIKM